MIGLVDFGKVSLIKQVELPQEIEKRIFSNDSNVRFLLDVVCFPVVGIAAFLSSVKIALYLIFQNTCYHIMRVWHV